MNLLKTIKEKDPWYNKGLKFKCTECGKCCTGKDGYVFLSEIEINAIAKFLQISKDVFLEKYTRCVFGKICLIDANQIGDCIFLKDKKCEIYPARPKQCKLFPWWSMVLKNKKSWDEFKEYCEGIDHPDGKFYSHQEIKENLDKNND